jgi:predicted phosphodiesterase
VTTSELRPACPALPRAPGTCDWKRKLAAALCLGLGALLLSIQVLAICPEGRERDANVALAVQIVREADGPVTLTRGPYLQSVTTDSVVVVWDTAQLATSLVEYGPTLSHGLVISDSTPVTHHALTLTSLSSYFTYHYRTYSNGQLVAASSSFRIAASPTQTTFSFVALGDTRSDAAAHQSVVDRAVTLSPDFVLHNGDFVYDGSVAAQWTTFFAIERELLRRAPLFGTLGNHERNASNYFDAFHLPGNERWYSFDYGNAHFVGLQIDGYADYGPGSVQYAWLENDLTGTDRLWKIVFFHIPPYSSGRHGGRASVRDALSPLFAQHGVDVVFNGHDHDYERSLVGDVTYIVTGGGGAPLYDQQTDNPYSVYFAKTYHCVRITVSGRMLFGVGVRPDGTQFDPFTILKPIEGHLQIYLPLLRRGGTEE